jgi:hypothetical protein
MARIDRLLERQAADLDRLDDREVVAFLHAYEDSRRELRERLSSSTIDPAATFTHQHLRVMLAQVEAGIRQLRERLGRRLDESQHRYEERANQNLLDVIRTAEPEFRDVGNALERGVLRTLTDRRVEQGIAIRRTSLDRYGLDLVDAIQRQLVLGTVQGETYGQLVNRLTRLEGSPFAELRGRAETIVRTEMSSAYDRAHQAALEHAAAVIDDPDDPLLKKADETRDLRNHAISRVLDGMTAGVNEPFRVPVSAVRAANEKLNSERAAKKLSPRKLGGILVGQVGGFYVGSHPFHYNDRGRQVPWRASWG